MAYPNPTTYTLPFGDKVRVSSRRRFVLVRQHKFQDVPYIPKVVKRSDSFDTVFLAYNPLADFIDYLIDQARGTVMISFNGRHEIHDAFGKRSNVLTVVPYGSPTNMVAAALSVQEVQS
jgi:hypothetical protein